MSRHIAILAPALILSSIVAGAALAADHKTLWDDFQDELAFGDAPVWKPLTHNYAMSLGQIETAYVVTAWRQGSEVGAYLRYVYAQPVSSADMPGPGPMKYEEVEAAIDCSARTVRVSKMYLFTPDNHQIGVWYDPDAAATPAAFDGSSIMGMAATAVC